MTILSDNIRRLRADRGMSQAALSRDIGVTSLKMIETGRVSSPRYSTLQAIARALGVTVADLYAEPQPQKKRKRTNKPQKTTSPEE